ncbi:MAG: sugar phosphate isomerase/epimerase family protein [Planctomycetota bacterium]
MAMKLTAQADSYRTEEHDFAYAVAKTKELGFKYIEPEVMTGRCLLNIHGYCNITSLEDDPMDMRKMIEKAGLKVACLSAHTNLINTEYGVDYLRKAFRFAYILGAPIVNTAEGVKPPDMPDKVAFNIIQYNLETLLKTAENYNIKLSVEPHGIYTTKAEGLLKIMSLADSPYLGINFDTGNTTVAGSDAVKTLKAVLKHVIHVHVKDIKRAEVDASHETGVTAGCAIGDGEVDIEGCIKLLKGRKYDGALAIECHSSQALKKSKAFLDPLIS